MTAHPQNSLSLIPGMLLYIVCSLVGLLAYLVAASATGLMSPIWWGGEALFFPLVFGVTVLAIGGFAFNLILRWVVSVLERELTSMRQMGGGAITGALLMPVQKLIALSVTAIPGWKGMAPTISVFVVVAVAAIFSAIVASLTVGLIQRSKA